MGHKLFRSTSADGRPHPRQPNRAGIVVGLLAIVLAMVVPPSVDLFAADGEPNGRVLALAASGDAVKPPPTIEVDGSVNESLDSTPWYDPQSRQLVPIELEIRQDDSIHRESRWLPKPKKIAQPDRPSNTTTTGAATATGLFGTSVTWGNLFGWVLLAAMVLGIVGITVYAISRAELRMENRTSTASAADVKGLPDEQTLERIKHLPPELRRTDVNLRTECERLMGEGRFDQAIILMLGHQLLLLDRNGLLRLSRGKTNGRYVRETRNHHDTIATWLRATADAFEQSYFGRHEISAHVFEQLWRQNEMLESATQAYGAGK
ncbi:hypothetical protein Enr13x_47400 [Stieleria neptunia]|uniref:Protein-glutamine gamma-glutamyltransferase-like C-terminal domain-containing protein n=1 Tax=Stieleria neptunia TaxID=2527979 RepID=A0A518HVK1_9BACT|nr:DUF4129 domain-containing protein [Stieleria neptunia]QDV44869.1 hypothetical protein Enr13x_47400 [Stieleria neptunia]